MVVLSGSVTTTLITGCIGIIVVLAAKFKCVVHCDGCFTLNSLKFGF